MEWATLLTLPFLAYGGICLYLYLIQERLVFAPPRGLSTTPADWGMVYREVVLESGGFALVGWYLPAPPEVKAAPVVLYCHGNACSIEHCAGHARMFHALGLGVMLFDYRGYGNSTGSPSEEGSYADALAALGHLTGELGVGRERLLYYGHSLGGGIATWLAERHPPAALVLEATYTATEDLAADLYPWLPVRLLLRHRFENRQRLAGMRGVPLLVMHSPGDEVIPFHHGLELHEAANPPKLFVPIAGPHDVGSDLRGAGVAAAVERFLAQQGMLPTPRP